MTDLGKQASSVLRIRANLVEACRYVRSQPDYAESAIRAGIFELQSVAGELDRPAREAEFDALMAGTGSPPAPPREPAPRPEPAPVDANWLLYLRAVVAIVAASAAALMMAGYWNSSR